MATSSFHGEGTGLFHPTVSGKISKDSSAMRDNIDFRPMYSVWSRLGLHGGGLFMLYIQ